MTENEHDDPGTSTRANAIGTKVVARSFFVTPADGQLSAVLAKIAEIETRPGYEGPKIGRRLQLIRISALKLHGDDGEEVFEDRLVGWVGRACDARGWRYYSSGPWWGEEEDTYRSHISDDEDRIIATAEGESRAIAAARAYRDALKETCE